MRYKKNSILFITLILITTTICISCNSEQNLEQNSQQESSQIESKQSSQIESDQIIDKSEFTEFKGNYLGDGETEILTIINNNPIDKQYIIENEEIELKSTVEILDFYGKYYDIWEDELEYAKQIITENLTGEALDNFVESQDAWEKYNKYEVNLSMNILILANGSSTGHSILTTMQSVDRIRTRTFTLVEYSCMLTGEYNFSYK